MLGPQEQVDAEPDLAGRAVISVGVAADKESDMPQGAGPLGSQQIVSSNSDYGSIGVVMVLLSYLIGLGVCIHLGAVAGRMWDERRSEPAAEPGELPAAADR